MDFDDFDDIDGMLPAKMLAEPSRTVTPVAPSDPARLGYPPTFPFEVALRTAPITEICEAYGITSEEWNLIRHEELFLSDLAAALECVKKEGMSFKVKARLQAEELLKTSWRTIHDPETPPTVKSALIQATIRWAGYDTPAQAQVATGTGFAININFSGQAPQPRLVNDE
ncbi:MAG: hypothetical protein KGN39_01750 [Betaproteobacteria bacterium]|nr:hypothetical protein [Betaproteobacteria bacterium]